MRKTISVYFNDGSVYTCPDTWAILDDITAELNDTTTKYIRIGDGVMIKKDVSKVFLEPEDMTNMPEPIQGENIIEEVNNE